MSHPMSSILQKIFKTKTNKGLLALIVLAAGMLSYSCHSSGPRSRKAPVPGTDTSATRPLSVSTKAVRLEHGGWGYKVEVNHKLYIFQQQIPCLEGEHPFPTQEAALAVAEIVQQKILRGVDPSVTIEELEGVLPAKLLKQVQESK